MQNVPEDCGLRPCMCPEPDLAHGRHVSRLGVGLCSFLKHGSFPCNQRVGNPVVTVSFNQQVLEERAGGHIENLHVWGWRDGPVVESTDCSSRGLGSIPTICMGAHNCL